MIVLIDSGAQIPILSRSHAKIDRLLNEFTLTDLHSTNGTYVNNLRVDTATLNPGDIISFGGGPHSQVGEKIEDGMLSVNYAFTIENYTMDLQSRLLYRPDIPRPVSDCLRRDVRSVDSSYVERESRKRKLESPIDTVHSLLSRELQCPICSDVFVDAVIFQCTHAACLSCLLRQALHDQSSTSLSCPVCKSDIACGTNSQELKSALHLWAELVQTPGQDAAKSAGKFERAIISRGLRSFKKLLIDSGVLRRSFHLDSLCSHIKAEGDHHHHINLIQNDSVRKVSRFERAARDLNNIGVVDANELLSVASDDNDK